MVEGDLNLKKCKPGLGGRFPGMRTILWYILFSVPIVVTVWMYVSFVVDGPFQDDYDAILKFINRFAPDRVGSAATSLAEFHNEHRIGFTRFCAWIEMLVAGKIWFIGLSAIGNALLLLLTAILVLEARRVGICGYWLIPIPCLVLLPQHVENSLAAMQSLQNIGVHAFALLAIHFSRIHRLLGFSFAVLAIVTSSNGLFVLPVISVFAFSAAWQEARPSLRRTGHVWYQSGGAVGLLIAAVSFKIYFLGFVAPPNHPSPWLALNHPVDAARYFFLLTAAPTWQLVGPLIVITAISILALFSTVVCFVDWRRHATIIQFALFELITMAAIAVARWPRGAVTALDARYRIVSLAFLAAVYILASSFVQRWNSKSWHKGFGVAVALFSIVFVVVNARTNIAIYQRLRDEMNYQLSMDLKQTPFLVYPQFRLEEARAIAIESDRKGVFHWPTHSNAAGQEKGARD